MTVSSAYQRNDEEDDRVDILFFFTKQQITFAYTLSTFENATFLFAFLSGKN